MASREELLNHLWTHVINANLNTEALIKFAASSESNSNQSFSDSAAAIQRIINAGISPQDICLANRYSAYSAVFSTLYAIGDPGVDNDDIFMLHESLLSSDPSGLEGRPN